MNLTSATYFITLSEELNFTRAADRLHITQQALSAHIASLEKELGTPLLIRQTPLRLTYAGDIFLQHAKRLQENLLSLEQEFRDITDNQRGVLKVGVGFTRGGAIMPRLITAFQKAYPAVAVKLLEYDNETLLRLAADREADLVIANFPAPVPGVTTIPFYEEEMLLLIRDDLFRKQTALSPAAAQAALASGDYSLLSGCPMITSGTDSTADRFFRDVCRLLGDTQPLIRASSANVATQLSLCLSGTGACIMPDYLAKALLPDTVRNQLLHFSFGETGKQDICFGYPEKAYQWKMVSEFIRISLQEELQK